MLTEIEHAVLDVLETGLRWWYDFQIVTASHGKLGGTVCVHLNLLEEKGLVESREETDEEHVGSNISEKRRLYRLTENGLLEESRQGEPTRGQIGI